MTQPEVHEFRKNIDAVIQIAELDLSRLTPNDHYGREMALVRTKLQEAKMWAGKILEVMGSELPEQFRDKAEMGDAH